MRNLIVTLFLFGNFMAIGQVSLDEYKYIVVPKKFDGFKKVNEHMTSTLVKHLFTEKGFNVVYDDAIPEELYQDRCLGLTAELNDQSSMFTTKTTLQLRDCKDTIVMTTIQGKSKEKEFKAAYGEAIREAFKSFNRINYKYSPKKEEDDLVTLSFKNDVKKLDEEKDGAKNRPEKGVVQEASIERQTYEDKSPVASDYKKGEPTKRMVKQVATTEEQSYKSHEPETSEIGKSSEKAPKFSSKKTEEVLYAQALPNGYQLVDSTPKIRLKIFKTSNPDYYLAKSESLNGLVYSKNGKWYLEYYTGEELTVEVLNIKF